MNICFLNKQFLCILQQPYTASILHDHSTIPQFSWKDGKRNTFISYAEHQNGKNPNPWILTQKLISSSFRLSLLAHVYNKAIWKSNHKTAPHGYFTTEQFYSAITKVLVSVTSCLTKFFSLNGDFQSMNLDALLKWQQSDMVSSGFFISKWLNKKYLSRNVKNFSIT